MKKNIKDYSVDREPNVNKTKSAIFMAIQIWLLLAFISLLVGAFILMFWINWF